MTAHLGIVWAGIAIAAAAAIYSVIAAIAVSWRLKLEAPSAAGPAPAISILKPLCGDEHDLYGCLRSFFDQHYPRFQIVLGVSDGDDPAIAVVKRLQQEFSQVDARLVIDRRQHGSSRKISNLINMFPHAGHDCLVISDSDVRVAPDYLSRLAPPLLDASVGIVTCAYRGVSQGGLWSLLGSFFINEWFIPSVRVAALFGSRAFAFGVTIALRREVLASVGGLAAIADELADDYRLGELTRARGLKTILSQMVVETCVNEKSFDELVRHEVRWLRTIRAVRPLGYAMALVTFSVPVACLGFAISEGATAALVLLLIAVAGRLLLHLRVRAPRTRLVRGLLVVLLRDLLNLCLWGWGFANRRVSWRDTRFHVSRDGKARQLVRIRPSDSTSGTAIREPP